MKPMLGRRHARRWEDDVEDYDFDPEETPPPRWLVPSIIAACIGIILLVAGVSITYGLIGVFVLVIAAFIVCAAAILLLGRMENL